jgi:hypothetical protein
MLAQMESLLSPDVSLEGSRRVCAKTRASGSGSTSAGVAGLLVLLACGNGGGGAPGEDSRPRQVLAAFTITQTGGGDRLWRLDGESGEYVETESTAVIAGVTLTYYRLDAPETLLTGDSGLVISGGRSVRVWGNVRVETVDGRVLETPELVWDESLEVFTTDCVAVLTIPDSLGSTVMTGRGVVLGRDLGSTTGVDVRESFAAIYSGKVPPE